MAKKEEHLVEVALLCASVFGQPGDVVEMSAATAQAGMELGLVDSAPAAVAYAKKQAAKEQSRAANYDKQYLGIGATKAEPDAK